VREEEEAKAEMRRSLRRAVALAPLAVILGASPAVAATITVTSTADNKTNDQLCTLREAVDAVNTNAAVNPAGGEDCPAGEATLDTIELDFATYAIGGSPSNESANVSGDFDVAILTGGPVTIDGQGSGQTTIDANDLDRGLDITGTGSATVRDLTVTDGSVSGALGGGVRSGTTNTSLDHVTISSSIVGGDLPALARGGGLSANGGNLTVTDSAVTGNFVNHDTGQPAVGSGPRGGGIYLQNNGSVTIHRSTISGNQLFSANTLQDLQGGGISARDDVDALTITNSTISGNGVSGGLGNAGGGMDWDGGSGRDLTIENSTFSGNTTGGSGGEGGSLHVANGSVSIAHTTFGPSTALNGKSIFTVTGPVQTRGSIFDSAADQECSGPDPTSLGYNAERGTEDNCGFNQTGDVLTNSQLLEPALAANGGPTQTHRLFSGAPVNGAIPVAACLGADGSPLLQDQRGAPRRFDDGVVDSGPECEPGAFEVSRCRGVLVNVVGTQADDGFITGTTGADSILGLGGNDSVDADSGVDTVCGGEGDDWIFDEDGDDDVLDGGPGTDRFQPDAFTTDDINFATGIASSAIDSDQVFSIENADGGFGDDTLVGDAGPNDLNGSFDDDTVTGGGGSDDLNGGPGTGVDSIFARDGIADVIDCGGGADTAQTDQPSLEPATACETLDALAEPVFPANPSPTPTPKKKCRKGRKLKKGKCVKGKRKRKK
jgi:CSLREA domain-containing protein